MKATLAQTKQLLHNTQNNSPENRSKVLALLKFIVNGEDLSSKEVYENAVTPIDAAFDSMSKAFSLAPTGPSSPQEDYNLMMELLLEWHEDPAMYVWPKFTVLVLGTTSSGKSSLINNLFTITVARTGIAQTDVGYTIIETVPSPQFAADPVLAPMSFSDEQLRAPLSQTIEQDPRYGRVFRCYDASHTLEMYKLQLRQNRVRLASYHNLRSVIINEDYLRGTPEDIALAKGIILIDSKGLDQADNQTALLADLEISRIFNKLCDLNLFLMGCKETHNCRMQLGTYELSLLTPQELEATKATLVTLHEQQEQQEQQQPQQLGIIGDLTKGAVNALYDWWYGADQQGGSSAAATSVPEGNSRWGRTRFVVTKIDEAYENSEQLPHNSNLQIFYTIGRLFGSSLRTLEPPTFDNFMVIGVPEQQHRERKIIGDLTSLKAHLLRAASVGHARMLDEAIIRLSDQVQGVMARSYNLMEWWNQYSMRVRAIAQQARTRLASHAP
eukprot:TRINITY_DN546_c0_g1_i3.p1 TRINITY_DN546_c0_g1~~TRINITY_DN546_c0_g1_i3.p1  ORF type:complete len:499 (-),score=121.55 TRINITY_DN546_c0_g1_i3:68-1564(-)